METIVVVLSSIIVILVIGILIHMNKKSTDNNMFKFTAKNIGQKVGTVTKLVPGQYMDKYSRLVSDVGSEVLSITPGTFGLNFKTSQGTTIGLTGVSYVVCRQDGIYFLDDKYNINSSYKPNAVLIATESKIETRFQPILTGSRVLNTTDNGDLVVF